MPITINFAHRSSLQAMCEAYMAYNKSMILLATTRFDLKRMYDLSLLLISLPCRSAHLIDIRESPVCMQQYIENIRKIAADPRNVIAANNLYDVHYIRYFAGNLHALSDSCSSRELRH